MAIVFATDIERTGATNNYETIGIGVCVLDSNFNELSTLFLNGYIKGQTVFEPRCWEEFWSKNTDKLDILEYKGDLSKEQRQKEMITLYQNYRKAWEMYCKKNNLKLELVFDSNIYDGGFLNNMIMTHLVDLPMPYSASEQQYTICWETHSQLRGLLMAVASDFKEDWGLNDKVKELYNVPSMQRQHDHNPVNDAYSIAYDQQVLLNIRDGKIKLKITQSQYTDLECKCNDKLCKKCIIEPLMETMDTMMKQIKDLQFLYKQCKNNEQSQEQHFMQIRDNILDTINTMNNVLYEYDIYSNVNIAN